MLEPLLAFLREALGLRWLPGWERKVPRPSEKAMKPFVPKTNALPLSYRRRGDPKGVERRVGFEPTSFCV